MQKIEKLMIRGIRSFNPNTASTLVFQSPLTLILGANGTGKTTIIEILKYITTGSLPPNSRNGAFIYDPKMAKEAEIKAQVKLKFTNSKNQEIVCTRSLQLSQKKNKVEQKTLESVLWMINDYGEQISISGKCAEIDKEMPFHLGVSSAILENVIFCHQEESTWPLSEPRVIKKKMDDIFDSSKHTKALDALKSLKRDQNVEIKMKKQELEFLYSKKKMKEQLETKLVDIKERKRMIEENMGVHTINLTNCESILKGLRVEIEKLEKVVNIMRGVEAEMKTLRYFVDNFCHEVFSDTTLSDIQKINLDEISSEIIKLSSKIKLSEDDLEVKTGLRNNYLKDKKRTETARLEFQSANIELEKINLNLDLSVMKYKDFVKKIIPDIVLPLSVQELKNEIEKYLLDLKSEIRILIDRKEEIEKRIYTLISSISANETTLTHLKASIVTTEDYVEEVFLPESELIELLRKLNEREFCGEIQKIEYLINIKQNELNEAYNIKELHIKNEIRRKRVEEIKEYISNNYTRIYDENIDSLSKFNNEYSKTTKEILELKKELKSREQDKYKQKMKHNEIKERTDRLKYKIQSLMLSIRTMSLDHNLSIDPLKCISENNLEIQLSELEEIKKNMTLSSSKHHTYKEYIKQGVIENKCPLCKRDFKMNLEKENFKNSIHDEIRKNPVAFYGFENRKANIEEEIRAMETENAIIRERNSLVGTLLGLVSELKSIIVFEDLETFLKKDDSQEVDDLYGDPVLELDIVDREEYLNHLKLGIDYLLELKKIEDLITPNLSEVSIDEIRSAIEDLQEKLQISKRLEKIAEKEKNDIKNKLRLIKIQNELKQQLVTNIKIQKEIENVSSTIEIKKSEVTDLKSKSEMNDLEIQALKSKYENIWQEEFKIYSNLINSESEKEKLINVINNLSKLHTNVKEIVSENEILDVRNHLTSLNSTLFSLKEKYSKSKTLIKVAEENLKLKDKKRELNILEDKFRKQDQDLGRLEEIKSKEHTLEERMQQIQNLRSSLSGQSIQINKALVDTQDELLQNFHDVDKQYITLKIYLKVLEMGIDDIESSIKAIDKSMVDFHRKKMDEVNATLKELWESTYKGNDIDYIELQADVMEAL